ncbi:MAG: YciI family protein [Candidatus Binataceae bacterium]
MHWLIKCRSKPYTDALRLATIDAHRNFLDGYPQVTWYSGPLFTDDNKNAIGSLRLIEFPDRDAALAYINADPYTRAGIFQAITIERWKPGLDMRQRDYARKDGTMQFVIHCHDKPDGDARRAPLRDAHLDYLNVHERIIVSHGSLLDDDGVKTIGSVLILDVADKAEADAFWAGEPFNRAGVYQWTMERWRFGHV